MQRNVPNSKEHKSKWGELHPPYAVDQNASRIAADVVGRGTKTNREGRSPGPVGAGTEMEMGPVHHGRHKHVEPQKILTEGAGYGWGTGHHWQRERVEQRKVFAEGAGKGRGTGLYRHHEQTKEERTLSADRALAEPAGVRSYQKYSGLQNQGSTCYLNTVLQILYMTKEFREAVLNLDGTDRDLSRQLKKLFEKLDRNDRNSDTRGITKSLGITNVCKQEDASEYFQKILNEINCDVSKIYEGTLKETVSCIEGHKLKETTSKFTLIPLFINSLSSGIPSVEDAWTDHFKITETSLYCNDCGCDTFAKFEQEIDTCPQILTLHLDRLNFSSGRKDYCKVKIANRMIIKKQSYELYAIANHYGSLRGGHYNAHIKPYEDKYWWIFNDSNVQKMGEWQRENLLNSDAADLLFYKKIPCTPATQEEGLQTGRKEMIANTEKPAAQEDVQPTEHMGDVVDQMQAANEDKITARREYLHRVVATVIFLGKQGIPFCGHDESNISNNQDNFLQCMSYLKQFDPFLKSYNAPSHATYLSPASQNELIACCAEEITESIVNEMKTCKLFAVMAEKASDHHTEQLAVCVRYVTVEGEVKESFLGLSRLQGFNAESITASVQDLLKSNGVDGLKCIAQAYYGPLMISGGVGKVQAHFQEYHPEAIYVHCYTHEELNLVLCHTCRAIPEAMHFFDTMESVYSFLSGSLPNHQKFEELQKLLELQPNNLVQLSQTQWACQLHSVNSMLYNFSAVTQCLSSIKTAMAVGLLSELQRFSTVYLLHMFQSLLSITEIFHKFLQKEHFDLAEAVKHKKDVYDRLKQKRTDDFALDMYEKTMSQCKMYGISEPSPPQSRKHKRISTQSPPDLRSDASSADDLKRKILFPCLDSMINVFEQRFSGVNPDLLMGIQACSPASDNFLSEQYLTAMADHYKIQLKPKELQAAKNFFALKKEAGVTLNMISVYKLLDHNKFPSLKRLVRVALTVPVSSCSCERAFSALRHLHTWLRSTMGQKRLHNQAVISIEKKRLECMEVGQIIDRFFSKK